MSNAPSPPKAELNTWSEIASHLGVSISQAQKWEKQAAMPVHRFPGRAKTRVVAYPEELDAWKRSVLQSPRSPTDVPSSDTGNASDSPIAIKLARFRMPPRAIAGAILLTALIAFSLFSVFSRVQLSTGPQRVEVHGNALTALDDRGQVLWSYTSRRDVVIRGSVSTTYPGPAIQVTDLDGDGSREVLFASNAFGPSGAPEESDELHCLSAAGQLLWRYVPKVTVTMGDTTFRGPWNITDLTVTGDGKGRKIWISLAHWSWRPGALVALSAAGTAEVKFVNAGHLYSIGRFSAGEKRYIITGGVNNEYAGAAVAVIREDATPSCSPQTLRSRYDCGEIRTVNPERYFVIPPTEIALGDGMPYNAIELIETAGSDTMVRTAEGRATHAGAIFSLSNQLELAEVTFNDSWALAHRRLERSKYLNHGLTACPVLRGPTPIRRWDMQTGWRAIAVPLKAGVGPDAYPIAIGTGPGSR